MVSWEPEGLSELAAERPIPTLDKQTITDHVEAYESPDYKTTFESRYVIGLSPLDIEVIRFALSEVAETKGPVWSRLANEMYERFDV